MTKKEIIVLLDEKGVEFNPSDKKETLEALLPKNEETPLNGLKSTEEEVAEVCGNSCPTLTELIDLTIEQANKDMAADRSKVLRLKNLVGKLRDAKRLIK